MQGRIQLFEKGGSTQNKTGMGGGGEHRAKLVGEEFLGIIAMSIVF